MFGLPTKELFCELAAGHHPTMPRNPTPIEIAPKREKLIEHLQAAQSLADEIGDGQTGFMVTTALIHLRDESWPKKLDAQE
jgi:hypothetical protein